jgi:hypothetical protein
MTRPVRSNGFLFCARAVLQKAKRPLSCKEIVEKAFAANLLSTTGLTPNNTMSATLNRQIAKHGQASGFRKRGSGRSTCFELIR